MVDLAVGGLGPGELIGGGASSTVFAATRLAFGDRVAVKVLKQTLTDEQSRSHFQREARALAELADIPGVVAVLDSGVNERGEPYLVFPLFEGSAQSDVNVNGAMAADRAARILGGAARAVHDGHQRGVIHRDLKPANLLLTNSDDIFVSDFGIAKLTDSSASASGWLGLTPAYAPPEALEGISGGVRGDVYSLGATLAALIIGAPPFSSTGSESPIALLNRVVNEPAPDLVAHGAPAAVAAVVAKAMAKSPADRHGSALEFAEALDAATAGPPAPAAVAAPSPPAAARPSPSAVPAPPAPAAPSAVPPPPAAVPPAVPPPPAVPSAVPPPPAAVPAPPAAVSPPPAAVPAPPGAAPPPAAHAGPSFEPPPVLATSHGPAPLTPHAPPSSTEDGGKNKMAIGVGIAVAAAAIIGGIFAFGGGGETVAPPEPTGVAAEPTAVPEPTSPPAPTAQPTVEPPATAVPTAVATEPTAVPESTSVPLVPAVELPDAVLGGPIDVYPGGAGEVADLAAAVSQAEDGDIIRLSPGVHQVGSLILIDKNIAIVGAGADQTMVAGTDNSVLFVEGTTGVTFRGFSATSDFVDETEEDDSRGIIQVIDADDLVIEDVSIVDAPGFGVVVVDSSVRIANSRVADSLLSGVMMAGASDAQLTNNTVTGSGESGFVWIEQSGGVAMGNTSDGNTLHGFSAEGLSDPSIVGNSAIGNEVYGFRVIETATASLRGNRATENEQYGFVWSDDGAGDASGNIAESNMLSGFFVTDDAAPTIVANSGFRNGEAGFIWRLNASGTASANRADSNGFDGFAILDDSTVALRANYGTANIQELFLNESSGATIDEGGVIRVELDGSGDTSDIASAVARAEEGDVVLIGAGAHTVPEGVQLNRDITIAGQGVDETSVNVDSENTVLLVETVSLNIRDLTLTSGFVPESDDDRFSIVELDRAADFVVDNITIAGSGGLGLGIFESTGTITNSTFTDNVWSGIGVAERSDVTIARNTLSSNGQSGLVFFEAARGFVGANDSIDNGFFGFSVQGVGSPEFVGNTASSNTSAGFAVAETSETTLVGNTSTGNETAGFVWFDTSSGTARANTATGNESSGFGVSEAASPTLAYNTSNSNEVDGFTWFETSSGLAVGNFASGNVFDGFAAEDESTPDLSLNVGRDNDRRSFNRAADANPVLTDNEFD